jgi:hypothetical protein
MGIIIFITVQRGAERDRNFICWEPVICRLSESCLFRVWVTHVLLNDATPIEEAISCHLKPCTANRLLTEQGLLRMCYEISLMETDTKNTNKADRDTIIDRQIDLKQ